MFFYIVQYKKQVELIFKRLIITYVSNILNNFYFEGDFKNFLTIF